VTLDRSPAETDVLALAVDADSRFTTPPISSWPAAKV